MNERPESSSWSHGLSVRVWVEMAQRSDGSSRKFINRTELSILIRPVRHMSERPRGRL